MAEPVSMTAFLIVPAMRMRGVGEARRGVTGTSAQDAGGIRSLLKVVASAELVGIDLVAGKARPYGCGSVGAVDGDGGW